MEFEYSKTSSPGFFDIPLVTSLVLMLGIFVIDLQLPLGVAGGVPYVAVILVSLWSRNDKNVFYLAVICSILTVVGYHFSLHEGDLWKALVNRFLAILAIWSTAILAIRSERHKKNALRIKYEAEKEVEKRRIFGATMHSALHITNNLLNQLNLVEFEIKNHQDFDKDTIENFDRMVAEANQLLTALSLVEEVDADKIVQSVYPKDPSSTT